MVMVRIDRPQVLVYARNPWRSGKLAVAAKKLGIVVRDERIYRNPPPWSIYREHEAGASERQKAIWGVFGSISKATKGLPIDERIEKIRKGMEGIKEELDRKNMPKREYIPRRKYEKFVRSDLKEYIESKLRELGLAG